MLLLVPGTGDGTASGPAQHQPRPGRSAPNPVAPSLLSHAGSIPSVAAPTPQATAGRAASTVRGSWSSALVELPVAGGSAELEGRVRSLLQRREAAIRAQDRAAWLAAVGPTSPRGMPGAARQGIADQQAAVFDRIVQLPLTLFRYDSARLLPPRATGRGSGPAASTGSTGSTGSSGSTAAGRVVEVRGTYALGRFGGPRTFRERFVLGRPVGGAGGPALLPLPDGSRSPRVSVPWDLPGMRVVRGRSSLVVGNAALSRLRGYARLADRAVQLVDRQWGTDWSRAPVLIVPATAEEYAGLTGQTTSAATTSQVAAVTTGPIDADGRASADQVVVRPATWSELTAQGRAAVVTHEVTHVATRASTTAPVPLWLSEGLADYLAYRAVALPPEAIAADLLDRVRSGVGPIGVPPDSAFGAGVRDLAASYQAAWLLCRHIATTHGEAALLRLYRTVAAGTPVRRAVPEMLGVDEDQLTAAWLTDLHRLSH